MAGAWPDQALWREVCDSETAGLSCKYWCFYIHSIASSSPLGLLVDPKSFARTMKRQKDRTLKDEFSRWVGAQYATGDQWRTNSRKNEGMEQKQFPVVDVTGDRSKVRCCKEQYCIGTRNVRSMNQGKLEVVKQQMARVNVNILGISKLK